MSEEITTTESTIKPEDIHLPPNSYWPIVLAFGFVLVIAGLALSLALALTGVIIAFVAGIGWVIEPVHDESEGHH